MNTPSAPHQSTSFSGSAGSAIVAAPTVVSAVALGRDGHIAAGERITIGMIGSGERANQLAQCLVQMADAQIVATCDPSRQKREALKAFFENGYAARRAKGTFKGCADYNDFRDLLARADIDAVVIAAPENWHALMAVAAARRRRTSTVRKR